MSSTILEFMQSSIESSRKNNNVFEGYLKSCVELGAFYSRDSADSVVKTINSSLNSTFDWEKGLTILFAFLPQTSVDAFADNAISWMVQCNRTIHQKGDLSDCLRLRVLAKLIQLSPKFPEVSRETSKQIVPKFLSDNIKYRDNSKVTLELLQCLQACMTEYPGPCGEFRNDILRLLLRTVEERPHIVRAAAHCIPLVAQVGGGGKQEFTHKTSWKTLQLGLVSLLHSLLNQIFEHVASVPQEEISPPADPVLTLERVSETNILYKTQRLRTQFVSVAQFLQAMLLQEFPVAKSVVTEALLEVVAHAQKPTHSVLGSTQEVLAVLSVLPSLQVAALHLLEATVLCLGRNLVPRGDYICYLCSQIIVWTHQQLSEWPYAMEKPYSETRLAAYSCLHSWLSVAGSSSQSETLVDKALPVMLADIHAQKPTVRLKVGSKSGKGKKKQQMLINLEDRSEKLGDSVANVRLCERALLTLTQLVITTTPLIKAEAFTSIMNTVLTLATELPVPFTAANCRNALYQLLVALCLSPHPTVSPPLAPALTIFSVNLHHPDPQVKSTCASALKSLEKIVHPTAPTLYFPIARQSQEPPVDENNEEQQSHDSPDENEVPVAVKKRRIDTSDIASVVLSDSDHQTSIKSVQEDIPNEQTCYDISDDSVDSFVAVLSENEATNDVVVNRLNKTENNDNVCETTNNTKVEKSIDMRLNENKNIDAGNKEDNDSALMGEKVPQIDQSSETLTEEKMLSETITIDDTLPEDTDVSVMLMDFRDEV